MVKLNIEKAKKPVRIDIVLEDVKDGVYLVDYEGDYIVIKTKDKLYGFIRTQNDVQTSVLVELDWNAWRTTKAIYAVDELKIGYTLKETYT